MGMENGGHCIKFRSLWRDRRPWLGGEGDVVAAVFEAVGEYRG
ncbi:MAG: hypothetical protein AAGA75_14505 [Cyanobacteria bacterium P01_E01_bin.6]